MLKRNVPMPIRAVTFDFGNTLADLDTELLAQRLQTQFQVILQPSALSASMDAAWGVYHHAITTGQSRHPWKTFMTALLTGGGATSNVAPMVDWLWEEQPRYNLWRKPVPGMLDVVRSLHRRGIAVAVISNSEGRLAELVEELGWTTDLPLVADSGRLGMEKPDPEIFRWTLEKLRCAPREVIHIGDSLPADVEGALRAGLHAVWFRGEQEKAPPNVSAPGTADALMQILDIRLAAP